MQDVAGARSGFLRRSGEVAAAQVQPSRQLEATTAGSLPFTGFAAVPTLLIGIALLSAGLMLQRRGQRTQAQT